MGIVPIWGFQLAVAITLSIIFKLNKALVILAAHISIPPMIPLIIFLSHYVGSWWLGIHAQHITFSTDITLVMIQQSFFQYVVGAITLAIVAGVTFGLTSYVFIKIFARHSKTDHAT